MILHLALICIEKNDTLFKPLNDKYLKLLSPFATVKEISVFNAKINLAQKQGQIQAQKAYSEYLMPYKKGFCVILHEEGKSFSSVQFANFLQDKNELSFFIGGAFGFEKSFIESFDLSLSLSSFTLAHHLVKTVLLEQIYRAFCINYKHPYHK